VIKEGVIDDPSDKDRREELAGLFRFTSTYVESDEQTVALKDYISRMKPGQTNIYYITAENLTTARNSPHLEIFRDKGVEVLLLTDPIDEWVTTHLSEFDGKPLQSVMKGELDLGGLESSEKSDGEEAKKETTLDDRFISRIKEILQDRIKDVRATSRLTTSPACLVAADHEMGRHLQQILKASGQQLPEFRPILEINPDHPLVLMLEARLEDSRFADWSHILFDQALLSEGGKLEDPAGFVKRMNAIFMELGDKQSGE